MKTTPQLTKVIRLDNLPLDRTYYTEEGYLKDNPIVTRTGIFEYTNADGTVSRELRLPEDVFAPESLQSYKGKPVIITHDAGLVNKDNVSQEQIGTILSEGYQDHDKVRAEIIIHDTDELKSCGLRELPLGYNLDLEYTSGVWNGQHYDAIQRNIRINHLALVQEARAGETARLNIDGRDKNKNFKEDSSMKKNIKKTGKRSDGVLSPEQLAQAIEEYKARRANRLAAKADEEAAATEEVVSVPPATDNEETKPAVAPEAVIDEDTPVEEKVEIVKDRRDRRDSEGDPATVEEAQGVIAKQDEDMDILFDIIDTLLAEKAFDEADTTAEEKKDEGEDETVAEDEDETVVEEENLDEGEETEEETATDEDETVEAAPTVEPKDGATMNADSVDAIVRQRVRLGMVGRMLNMDGLETMKLMAAKKTVIKAVRPGLRLDGKSRAYINAAFDCAVADVMARSKKDTKYQKKQMFNGDSRTVVAKGDSASAARERMIKRQFEKEDK